LFGHNVFKKGDDESMRAERILHGRRIQVHGT
jgi:hypothetical protein